MLLAHSYDRGTPIGQLAKFQTCSHWGSASYSWAACGTLWASTFSQAPPPWRTVTWSLNDVRLLIMAPQKQKDLKLNNVNLFICVSTYFLYYIRFEDIRYLWGIRLFALHSLHQQNLSTETLFPLSSNSRPKTSITTSSILKAWDLGNWLSSIMSHSTMWPGLKILSRWNDSSKKWVQKD